MNDDELTLRRKRQSADRARAYRQRRKKDLDASPKLLHQKKLNAERCRRYRQKCKQLKLAANCNQVTIDSDTSTSRDAVVARYIENNESIGLTAPVDCAVDGCRSSMKGNTNILFFNLPLDDQRRIAWAELIGRPDLADPKSKEKCYGVCSLHFDGDMIHYIPRLKTNALPNKLLPHQSASTDSSLGTIPSEYTYETANDSAMEDIPMEASANIKYSRVDMGKRQENYYKHKKNKGRFKLKQEVYVSAKMDGRNLSTDEIARRRALANACVRRYREKKRRIRAEELNALAEGEQLTEEMKYIKEQKIKEEKAQRRKELARERSRRYRERRRTDGLDPVDQYSDDSHVPGSSQADILALQPSQSTLEIKKEIESDNEEEVSSIQYSDYRQTEIALETVKVEYDIDIEDHFSESIAKNEKLSDVNFIENKEKSIIKTEPVASQPQIEDKRDNYDGFGAYIATLLRALPPKKALAVQPKIVELIVLANNEDHQT